MKDEQLTEIKDIKEKQLQLAYHMSRHQGDSTKFSASTIYDQWCKWWREDFMLNGGIEPVLRNDRIVASRKNADAVQPDYIQYYNQVLENVRTWITYHYDNESSPRANSDRFKEQLFQLRDEHFEELQRILSDSGKGKYYVMNGASIHHPCRLGTYWLYKHGENQKHLYYAGTYDHIKTFLTELLPE